MKFLALGGVVLISLLQAKCQPEPTLTITLGGDVILGREGKPVFTGDPWGGLVPAETAADGSRNWFLVNLESPLGSMNETTHTSKDGYNLCAPTDAAAILNLGSVDLVSVANNHLGDCGETNEPSRVLPGITPIFEGQPAFLESPAGTAAIVAVDAVSKPLDMAALLADVDRIRAKADFVIVSLHWGREYAGEPTRFQREQAQQLADAGVDVLWGHHPHVLQPAEWIDSADGSHHMLALYSLGNLLTDQTMTFETRHSAIIELEVKRGKISQLRFQPLVLMQKGGRLTLVSADKDQEERISDRLGWGQLLESLP